MALWLVPSHAHSITHTPSHHHTIPHAHTHHHTNTPSHTISHTHTITHTRTPSHAHAHHHTITPSHTTITHTPSHTHQHKLSHTHHHTSILDIYSYMSLRASRGSRAFIAHVHSLLPLFSRLSRRGPFVAPNNARHACRKPGSVRFMANDTCTVLVMKRKLVIALTSDRFAPCSGPCAPMGGPFRKRSSAIDYAVHKLSNDIGFGAVGAARVLRKNHGPKECTQPQ